jgi:acetolactate synthase I/II/III large subunit
VFNDNDNGLIIWKQRMHGGRSTGSRMTNPDFKKDAESFGIKACSLRSLEQLSGDLRLALNQKGLSFVDIPIDP